MNIAWILPLADDGWDMHGDIGAGWWIVMVVGMVIFWGAVILGIFWFARASLHGWRGGRPETPMEILERRFAEGAISVDEYHERQAVIIAADRHRHGVNGDKERVTAQR